MCTTCGCGDPYDSHGGKMPAKKRPMKDRPAPKKAPAKKAQPKRKAR